MAGSGNDSPDPTDDRANALKSLFTSPPDPLKELANEMRGLLETALSTRPGSRDYEGDMRRAVRRGNAVDFYFCPGDRVARHQAVIVGRAASGLDLNRQRYGRRCCGRLRATVSIRP